MRSSTAYSPWPTKCVNSPKIRTRRRLWRNSTSKTIIKVAFLMAKRANFFLLRSSHSCLTIWQSISSLPAMVSRSCVTRCWPNLTHRWSMARPKSTTLTWPKGLSKLLKRQWWPARMWPISGRIETRPNRKAPLRDKIPKISFYWAIYRMNSCSAYATRKSEDRATKSSTRVFNFKLFKFWSRGGCTKP